MSKIRLSKEELAVLDALITSMESGEYSPAADSAAFITAIVRTATAATRIVTKATPVVTQVTQVTPTVTEIVGGAAELKEDLSSFVDQAGNLNLDKLIELRKKAS